GVPEVLERQGHVLAEPQHLEVILRLAPEELLAGRLPHLRLGVHENAGLRAVLAGEPAAGGVLDVAIAVELGGVLAEVPDVAVAVLRVVVGRPLLEAAAKVEAVRGDGPAGRGDRAGWGGHPPPLARPA